MTDYTAREPYDRVVHVPPQTATRAQFDIVANEAYLRKQSLCFSVDDACIPIKGLKSRTIIFWGVPVDKQQSYRIFVDTYYFAAIPTVIEFRQFAGAPPPVVTPPPVVQPPPATTSKVLLGVNVLGNHDLAFQYAAQGCRYFLILDNFGVAAQLADRYPDAIVVHRHYVGWHMEGEALANHMMAGQMHPRVIYETLNEADHGQGYGSASELNDRLNAELSAAAITGLLRERVAPLYNGDSGVYIGFHLYTRRIGQDFDVWYARRWTRLFEACGFDPRLRKVLCSETGVDEGGVGGFPAHGYSPDQFAQWCRDWLACEAQPCAGQQSQILGGALFQVGNGTSWAGYNVEGYMPRMTEFWR